MLINTTLIVFIFAFVVGFMLVLRIRTSLVCRAALTPLSSILGSGFLLAIPLLSYLAGAYAPVILFLFLSLAYMVGSAIRYNIMHVEESINKKLVTIDQSSAIILSFAYVGSITFYIMLMSSIVIHAFGVEDDFQQKIVSSLVVLSLALVGKLDGIHLMEHIEYYTVKIKFGLIAGFICSLGFFSIFAGDGGGDRHVINLEQILQTNYVYILGAFLAVQGFECCRYMGKVHSRIIRIKAMRIAQLLSAIVFLLFSISFVKLMDVDVVPSAHLMLDVIYKVSPLYFVPFVLLAVLGQLGAATADKVGVSCLLHQLTNYRVSVENLFVAVGAVSLSLIWMLDVFELMVLATRLFVIYYAMQCMVAAIHCFKEGSLMRLSVYACLSCIMLFIAMFGDTLPH